VLRSLQLDGIATLSAISKPPTAGPSPRTLPLGIISDTHSPSSQPGMHLPTIPVVEMQRRA